MAEQIIANTWGGFPGRDNPIHFHPDTVIGRAIAQLGDDATLDVDGHALANVLGWIATGATLGTTTTQHAVDRLIEIKSLVPQTSDAYRVLRFAVSELEAPATAAPELPAGTPAPIVELLANLYTVPIVRRDPSRESDDVVAIATEYAASQLGGRRVIARIENLRNLRHESTEGKLEIDRYVAAAVAALTAMVTADRTSLYPQPR